MTTLTEFLLARLADLEALARAVQDEKLSPSAPIDTGDDPWPSERAFAEHLTPARVLADVAAKRAIVERCAEMLAVECWEYDDAPKLAEEILCDLATIYADHESYDESWRP